MRIFVREEKRKKERYVKHEKSKVSNFAMKSSAIFLKSIDFLC